MNHIRSLIANGCSYMGVCAGASLACGDAHFTLDDKPHSLSSLKLPRLALLPKVSALHTTLGPAQNVAQFTQIKMQNNLFPGFFHEGCHFVSTESQFSSTTVLATYESAPQKPVAAIQTTIKKSTLDLFGFHPERSCFEFFSSASEK